ncbi:MAG: deoxynucleoside kinase [Candidatus Vogelbacteria bacterium]|nr:deoxynucleoside kinase [Candidatus Vogelbacteria bacterium]
MVKGKFIVIDGADGSGKATQAELLVRRLKKEKIKVKKIDFPQYENNFFGHLLGECLAGKYGDFIAIPPRIASVLYAADRFESSTEIRQWLADGYIVVADRYASANQIHQGGKIADPRKRTKFLKWLDQMEFGVFNIPRPDIIIYLHVPLAIGQELIKKRVEENRKNKTVKAKKDLAESNLKYLAESQKSAIKIVKKNNAWQMIDCAKEGKILGREEINQLIYDKLKRTINR